MRMEGKLFEKGLWDQVSIEVDPTGKTHEEVEAEKAKLIAKRTPKKMDKARAKMIARVEAVQLAQMC